MRNILQKIEFTTILKEIRIPIRNHVKSKPWPIGRFFAKAFLIQFIVRKLNT